jgi:hypothetical protein
MHYIFNVISKISKSTTIQCKTLKKHTTAKCNVATLLQVLKKYMNEKIEPKSQPIDPIFAMFLSHFLLAGKNIKRMFFSTTISTTNIFDVFQVFAILARANKWLNKKPG